MSIGAPSPSQWPLRPDAQLPRRDVSAELLELKRDPEAGKLSGLCHALAGWLGVDVLLVRTVFVIAALASGVGVLAYLAGWLVTRDVNSGVAPLDKMGDRWRQLSPRTLVAWSVAIILLTGLTFGSMIGFGWLPLIIVGLTVWTGVRIEHNNPQPALPAQQQHRQLAARRQTAPPRAATAVARPAGPTWLVSLVTLLVAALAAGIVAEVRSGDYLLIASVALLVIAAGLLIGARRGTAVGLVVAGVILSLGMGAAAAIVSQVGPHQQVVVVDRARLSDDLYLQDDFTRLDMSGLTTERATTWTVHVNDSAVTVTPPDDQVVTYRITYTDSVVIIPHEVKMGNGTFSFAESYPPEPPAVYIDIIAGNSVVEVKP